MDRRAFVGSTAAGVVLAAFPAAAVPVAQEPVSSVIFANTPSQGPGFVIQTLYGEAQDSEKIVGVQINKIAFSEKDGVQTFQSITEAERAYIDAAPLHEMLDENDPTHPYRLVRCMNRVAFVTRRGVGNHVLVNEADAEKLTRIIGKLPYTPPITVVTANRGTLEPGMVFVFYKGKTETVADAAGCIRPNGQLVTQPVTYGVRAKLV